MTVTKIIVTQSDGSTEEFDAPVIQALQNDLYFSSMIIVGAQTSHKKFWPKGPFVSVTLAQWALESGFGKHQSGSNNYFGIKATKDQIASGDVTYRSTREETADGQSYTIEAAFANYASVADCFDAHAALLTTKHYQACMEAQTPEDYCVALQKSGYATANNYSSSLLSLIKTHNLKQYDQRF